MYCRKCNSEIANGSAFCPNCGANVNSIETPSTNNYQGGNTQYNGPIDNPSHLAGAVSCCFPIVGLILYFIWKDDKPNSAKVVCYWMLAGLAIWVIFYFLFFVLGFAGFANY